MDNKTVLPSCTSTLLKIGILFSGLFILYGFVLLLMYTLANISLLMIIIPSLILNIVLYLITVNIIKSQGDFASKILLNLAILLNFIAVLVGLYTVYVMNVNNQSLIFLLLFYFIMLIQNITLVLLGMRLLKKDKSIPYINLFSLGLFSNVISCIIINISAFTMNYDSMIAFALIKNVFEGAFYYFFFYFNLQRIK